MRAVMRGGGLGMNCEVRKKISVWLKLLTLVSALAGVFLSFVFAKADGYSHWSKRLLYFTGLSNIWIAVFLIVFLSFYVRGALKNEKAFKIMYYLRFVFTISITVTGIIFCAVLAPFSKNAGYNAWTLSSILTHVLTPALAIFDFFFDPARIELKRWHLYGTTIPLVLYCIFASILILLKVDFGRGDPFPYVFLNFYSPAGFFGFSNVMPYVFGSFYWLLLIFFLVIGLAKLYAKFYKKTK